MRATSGAEVAAHIGGGMVHCKVAQVGRNVVLVGRFDGEGDLWSVDANAAVPHGAGAVSTGIAVAHKGGAR